MGASGPCSSVRSPRAQKTCDSLEHMTTIGNGAVKAVVVIISIMAMVAVAKDAMVTVTP